MSDYNLILAGLKVYPSLQQINEAANYAKEITIGYISKIDRNAIVIVEDGDVDVYSSSDFNDLVTNAQYIFDSAFSDKIEKIQQLKKSLYPADKT